MAYDTWKLIHIRLIHTSDSVMKAMYRHQILTDAPKQVSKKTNQAPCTICYTENMTNFLKCTTVDTTNPQPG